MNNACEKNNNDLFESMSLLHLSGIRYIKCGEINFIFKITISMRFVLFFWKHAEYIDLLIPKSKEKSNRQQKHLAKR